MNETFKLLDKFQKTADYIKNITQNISKNERILKDNIEKDMYKSLENIYYYIIQENENIKIKNKYLKDLLVNLAISKNILVSINVKQYVNFYQN